MGYVLTQRTVVDPLADLERSAKRIAGGDLDSPIQITSTGSVEVRTLAESLESMRQRLADSHNELESWAADLESRVTHRTAELAALFELSNELSGTLEIARVLQWVTDKTRELAGGDVAVLCLVDPADREMMVSAVSGSREALVGYPETLGQELGSVDISAQPDECANETEKTKIPLGQLLKSRKDAAIVLDLADEALDQMTLFVKMLIVAIRLRTVRPRWNHGLCTTIDHRLAKIVGVV
jgi:nitrate/nitrite-specific signal transduction histidine kinase